MSKKEEIVSEIYKDKMFSEMTEKLNSEEKEKVDGIITNFIDNFLVPLQELISKADDEAVQQDIKQILQNKMEKK